MPEMGEVSRASVMTGNVVEESWSKFVPASDTQEPEFDRNNAIPSAVKRTLERRARRQEAAAEQAPTAIETHTIPKPTQSAGKYFFIYKTDKFKFLGKSEEDLSRFQKDLSGRFFREWVKKTFGIDSADDVVCYDGNITVAEMMEMFA